MNPRDWLLREEIGQVGLGILSLSTRQTSERASEQQVSERALAGLPGALFSASLPAADQAGTEPFTLSTGIYGCHLCVGCAGGLQARGWG